MSAVMVHVSHAYKNMDMARERISLILELMVMFLSFQMTFSLVTTAVVWAVLDSTSGLDPSSAIRYYSSQIFKAMDGLQFLVIYGNVSADAIGVICHQLGLLCTNLHVEASSRLFINLTSSCSCPVSLNCPASDTDCSFMVFKCVSHYSVNGSANKMKLK